MAPERAERMIRMRFNTITILMKNSDGKAFDENAIGVLPSRYTDALAVAFEAASMLSKHHPLMDGFVDVEFDDVSTTRIATFKNGTRRSIIDKVWA